VKRELVRLVLLVAAAAALTAWWWARPPHPCADGRSHGPLVDVVHCGRRP
jgi:hypothetical protein